MTMDRSPRSYLVMTLALTGLVAGFSAAAPAASSDAVALLEAARAGHWEQVRALVAGGLDGEDVDGADSDGTRPLHWAVRADELEVATLLLEAGADATASNRLGLTALYLAAANGNGPMIRRLLDRGADPRDVGRTGETMLMVATRSGSADAVRALLERGADPEATEPQLQLTALMLAAEAGATGAVRALLEHGADVQARSRPGEAPGRRMPCVGRTGCGSHGVGIVRGGLPEQGYQPPISGDMTPLMFAAREGHVEVARLLLDAGAEVNAADRNGITPLFMAIGSNRIPAARLLVERGADIHATDWYGRTPLFAAVEIRNVDLHYVTFEHMLTPADRADVLDFIELLLDRGADPDIRVGEVVPLRSWMYLLGGSLAWVDFTGQTPFLLASLSGDVSTMRLLLQHGADPHSTTFGGTTALMAAAGVNWVVNQTYDEGEPALLEAVQLCLELGMDVNATNSMGLTALMGAANRGSDAIIEFLVANGARLDATDNEGRSAHTWAEGVFLATHAPVPKPSSIALIEKLAGAAR